MRAAVPVPTPVLQSAQAAEIRVELPSGWATLSDRLPIQLSPRCTVLSAQDPVGLPNDDNDARHTALLRSLRQSGHVFVEAEIHLDDRVQRGVAVVGLSLGRAVKLAYKRKQWVVWRQDAEGRRVVYTGLNSREK
jgi:hypothetical protein